MHIDIITKQDLQSLEETVNELAVIFRAKEAKGLGIVFTTKELAAKLKVSTKTINNWREDRIIEFCKVNNVVLFTEKAVLEFLAGHSIKRRNNIVNRIKSTTNDK